MEFFCYIKPTKKHSFGGPGMGFPWGLDLFFQVILEGNSRAIDWSGQESSSQHFSFSEPKKVTIHRVEGHFFYPAEFQTLLAPLAAVGAVIFFKKPHSILEECLETSGGARFFFSEMMSID